MSDFFNEAYQRARARFSTEQWLALQPQQVTEAIYLAMREMDAGDLPASQKRPPTQTDSNAGPSEPRDDQR